jgi:two-component system, OmpR family, sensor histidine kinase BaeS
MFLEGATLNISIGNRLLVAILLSFAGIAALSLELVRWRLLDNPPKQSTAVDTRQLAFLTGRLSSQFAQYKSWSFLPADPNERKVWLRETLHQARFGQLETTGEPAPSLTLGYRIGLLDKDRRYLAGVLANRLIIVFASIDRVELPILADGAVVGYLVYAKPQNADDGLATAFFIDQQDNILIIGAFSVFLSVVVAALLATTFRKPIRQLVKGAQRLEQGQFDARLNMRRGDELGQLALTFDHLAARLEDTELRRRQWVADTSHELRTPLSILGGQIEALQDGVRTATPENLALLRRQVQSLTTLVDELYDLARGDLGQLHYTKSPVNLWRVVAEEAEGFSEKVRSAGLTVVIGAEPARSIVNGDANRIHQVIRNLLENSVRYTAAGGRIEIHGQMTGNELRIDVDDSAPGVPASSLNRLGERFFRVEGSRNRQSGGSGLGLALSRQILQAHDGRLEFTASPLGGLRASLILPLSS